MNDTDRQTHLSIAFHDVETIVTGHSMRPLSLASYDGRMGLTEQLQALRGRWIGTNYDQERIAACRTTPQFDIPLPVAMQPTTRQSHFIRMGSCRALVFQVLKLYNLLHSLNKYNLWQNNTVCSTLPPNPIRLTKIMTKSTFALPLSIFALAVFSLLVTGQEQRRPLVTPQPSRPASTPQQTETFNTNYRVTFSGKSADESLGELSTLTCARNISISGPLKSSNLPVIFTVSGILEEKDGLLIFTYSIEFRGAVITTQDSRPGQPQMSNIQYQDHFSRGALRMKPGKTYELLKSGENIYSIVVAPENDK